jgi:preprotein translocase subunit YajC
MDSLLFIGVMIAAFWFLIIRPQQVRQRKHAAMVEALAVGDEIVTIGGLYATVVWVGERIRVRVADGSEVEIAPVAVGQVITADPHSDDEPVEELEVDGDQQ